MSEEHQDATGPVGPELLGRLIDRHGPALKLYAGQWCDCPEDVVQDALIELARCPEAPRQVLAWLYRAVRFRAMSASRSTRRRKRHETEAARQRPAAVFGPPVDGTDAQWVTSALASLPDAQREVVVAHVWGGLTFKEIGRVIGISDSTAHRRFQAALRTIRQKWVKPCPKKS